MFLYSVKARHCKILISLYYIIGLWILKWKKLYVFKWIYNGLESCLAPLILTLVRYFLFCKNIYMKKESPGYGESEPCQYSRLLTCKKSGLELGLAQAAGPLGNLAARKSWPAKRASLARRESAIWRKNLKIEFRSCWGLREKGSKQELPKSNLNLSPNFSIIWT